MRILFWVPYPSEGPSNRYRIEQYLPYLRDAGIDYRIHRFWLSPVYRVLYKRGHYLRKLFYFLIGTLSRLWDLLMISRYDIVCIHRESFPIGEAFFERCLIMLHKSYIFDFDDAIFLPSSSINNSFIERFKNPGKVKKIIKMSKIVIAGNGYLADFASKFNKNINIIPTTIDTGKYYFMEKEIEERIIIGWIGSFTTLNFVNLLHGVFRTISLNFSNAYFKIVGGIIRMDGISRIVSKQWAEEEEIQDLRSFDIGVMPMPDNEWTRGKCGFKAILYMSMGIPCICSPVGVNKEIIIDGWNGFLANGEQEWIEKISLLIKDPDLRKKIGMEGRRTIEEKYSVKTNADIFLKIIKRGIDKNGTF